MGKERRKSSDGYIGKNRGLDLNMHYIVGKAKVVKKNGRLEIKREGRSVFLLIIPKIIADVTTGKFLTGYEY